MSDSSATQVVEEAWTIVDERGALMLAYGALTRDEASTIVAEDSHGWSGGPYYAVPDSVAKRLSQSTKAIAARHAEAVDVERRLAVRIELGLATDALLGDRRATPEVRYGGPGRGWFVTRTVWEELGRTELTLAGPFTSREEAEREAEARR